MSQYPYDFTLRIMRIVTIAVYFNHNLVTCYCRTYLVLRYKNIFGKLAVIRNNETICAVLPEYAYNLVHSMFKNSYNSAFPAPALCLFTGYYKLYLVLMQCIAGIGFPDKNIFIFTLNGNKTKSSVRTLENTCKNVFVIFAVFSLGCDTYFTFQNKSIKNFI